MCERLLQIVDYIPYSPNVIIINSQKWKKKLGRQYYRDDVISRVDSFLTNIMKRQISVYLEQINAVINKNSWN